MFLSKLLFSLQILLIVYFIDCRTSKDLNEKKINNNLCNPTNISVVLTHWNPPAVTVQWSCRRLQSNGEWKYINLEKLNYFQQMNKNNSFNELSSFRIAYSPYETKFRYIQEVPAYLNSTNIDNLQPNTKYVLTISAISINDTEGIKSHEIDFVSPSSDTNDRFYNSFSSLRIRLDTDETINIRVGEVIVVVAVLCAWLGIIFLFIKKWGKIRTLEPNRSSHIHSVKNIVETSSLNGAGSAPSKSRLQSFANISTIPKLQMSDSHQSLYSENQSLLANNSCNHLLSVSNSSRPRINSVFLMSPSHRDSLMLEDFNLPRRYKSAEDLQSLVMHITETQRQQRKLSQCSIKESDVSSNYTSSKKQDSSNPYSNYSNSYFHNQNSTTTRGSSSCLSRDSVGTLRLTDVAAIAMAASNSQLSKLISPSKKNSSTGTTSSSGSCSNSVYKQTKNFKNSSEYQVLDSNQNAQALIDSKNLENLTTINCSYCRRRMSNCEKCTHCNGMIINNSNFSNRNLILMQSKSFINHTCSSENSSFENNPLTSSNSNLNSAVNSSPCQNSNLQLKSSLGNLFQINEANDDVKHIDDD